VGFIGIILLPIVGNAAEHAGAVIFAFRNKLVCFTSSFFPRLLQQTNNITILIFEQNMKMYRI